MGGRIKVELAKDLLSTTKMMILAPKPLSNKSSKQILGLLKTENESLKTEDWYVISHTIADTGITMFLIIDELSLNKRRMSNMKAYVELWKATFSVLASAKGENDGQEHAGKQSEARANQLQHRSVCGALPYINK